ncbi:hypothetical protein CSOJ01_06866 [Colletotrichum sojae]|uniref:Uncharacterized protein n=1 Tax=Colletotrichum sojae TaxID=2175907 RepID=A0A8H6JAP2_9PEZI|nr:hypothetical protein CSOJ01_06866 [Colletotrichum sojae]
MAAAILSYGLAPASALDTPRPASPVLQQPPHGQSILSKYAVDVRAGPEQPHNALDTIDPDPNLTFRLGSPARDLQSARSDGAPPQPRAASDLSPPSASAGGTGGKPLANAKIDAQD